MKTTNRKTPSSVFWLLIILSFVIGYVFFFPLKDSFDLKFLVFFSGIPFLFFATGAFGLLWPKVKPTGDELYIYHALIIGVLFFVLFLLHVWVVLPLLCVDFASQLGL
ncbi:MAG TPA: hypothetical protein VFD80_01625 [Flavobacteriaceae bacterium]|nr:hypothetical protein [Flavobacteriaceae bacterium]